MDLSRIKLVTFGEWAMNSCPWSHGLRPKKVWFLASGPFTECHVNSVFWLMTRVIDNDVKSRDCVQISWHLPYL